MRISAACHLTQAAIHKRKKKILINRAERNQKRCYTEDNHMTFRQAEPAYLEKVLSVDMVPNMDFEQMKNVDVKTVDRESL